MANKKYGKQADIIAAELGARLKDMRQKRKLSQEEFAGAMKLARPSVTNIERGRQNLTVYHLLKACAVLRCKPSQLLPPIPSAELKYSVSKRKLEFKTVEASFKW